jgi:hypothetical protein
MHAEENPKPKTRKEKKKKSTEFLLGSGKYIARCLITKYLQQFVSLLQWNAAGTHYDCCTCRSETTNAQGKQDQPPSKQDEKK